MNVNQPLRRWRKSGQALLAAALLTSSFLLPAYTASAADGTTSGGTSSAELTVNKPADAAYFYDQMKRAAETAGVPFTLEKATSTVISRQTAAQTIQDWLSLPTADRSFKDTPQNSSYADAISAVAQAGIMTGYSKDSFFPRTPLTVSDVQLIYERVLEYIQPFEIEEATISDMQQAMEQGKLTSVQLVQMYLDRIEQYDDQGPSLNAVLTINEDALDIAAELDKERTSTGLRSHLHGIPILVKDNYDTNDMPTSAGCLCLKDSIPDEDAEQIARLKKAGAIILGKTNLHEFAFGITTSSSLGGQTLNPYALDHYPGGSSGGTGAAIAANFAAAGLGTDTGGSIRIPSSFNSLVGIRPTIGLASRDGIIPLALTQDVGGPMARTVEDAAIMLDAIAGYDPEDVSTAASVGRIPESYLDHLHPQGLQGARIGIATELFSTSSDAEQETSSIIYNAIDEIEGLGATAVEIKLPNLAELSKYPSLSSYEFKFQLNDYLKGLGEDAPYATLSEIIASGNYDLDQEQSMKSRDARETLETEEYKDIVLKRTKLAKDSLLQVMADHNLDAIVYPSTAAAAAVIGEPQNAGGNNRLSAFSGFPAITVPAGFTKNGLPVGIEFLGRAYDEGKLIKLAYSYEQGTQHRIAPMLSE